MFPPLSINRIRAANLSNSHQYVVHNVALFLPNAAYNLNPVDFSLFTVDFKRTYCFNFEI